MPGFGLIAPENLNQWAPFGNEHVFTGSGASGVRGTLRKPNSDAPESGMAKDLQLNTGFFCLRSATSYGILLAVLAQDGVIRFSSFRVSQAGRRRE